ncbi:hypothetical protein QOZ80_6AG0537800 [Eleusine coracana subsp. coracana]|nr:hypothetical protein QOZ80_6AG0537800 [Eleusine coracana subsp. coracana]
MATDESGADEVAIDAPTYFRIFKSGRIERLHLPPALPAGLDEATGVSSKDVVLDSSTGLTVRVYLPKLPDPSKKKKLPVLVYIHGGGFVIESAFSSSYHNYLNLLAATAGVIVASVEYRLAPEHPLPAAYEDCWAALRWAASAQDEWIAEHGDVARLFVAGDSAGGNATHDMLVRASGNGDDGPTSIEGAILFHPWFGGSTLIDGEEESSWEFNARFWAFVCPGAVGGSDDPRVNPVAPGAPPMEKQLGCKRMLVCAATEDKLFARERAYYDAVAASAWPGTVDWFESDGEEHVFFLNKPECDKAKQLMDRVVAFIAGA